MRSAFNRTLIGQFKSMRAATEPITLENFIGGKFVKPVSGKYITSYNPATGKVCKNLITSMSNFGLLSNSLIVKSPILDVKM